MVLRLLFIYFQFLEAVQNLIPKVWQAVFPISLFTVGLFNPMYMASLMALAIFYPSLHMILKFSTDVVWPELFWCSKWVMVSSNVHYIFPQKF